MNEMTQRNSTELDSFHWLDALDSRPDDDCRTWVYSDKKKRFTLLTGKKLQPDGQGEKFVLPKKYKGKRLSKNEMMFLLTARKEWGEYVTKKPEYIDALLVMHRSTVKTNGKIALLSSFIAGGIFSCLSIVALPLETFLPNVESSLYFSTLVSAAAGVSVAAVSNRSASSTNILEVFKESKRSIVHPDFLEFYDYLDKEWRNLSLEEMSIMDAIKPDPRKVKIYREQQKLLSRFPEHIKELATVGDSNQCESIGIHKNIFDMIKEEWSEWEMDILRIVQYPTLFDMRESATADFHRALLYAESAKPAVDEAYSASHPFVKAISDLQFAWSFAKSEAERIQQSNFEEDERVRLSRALDLLRIALSVSGTPAERQAAYQRAMKQLEGLVQVPTRAIESLASGMHLRALESAV